jgi:2-keto-3-deoxy-6-phosphogluconate aldolase
VLCVGMSSIVTKAWLDAGDWAAIRNAATAAAKLAPELRAG